MTRSSIVAVKDAFDIVDFLQKDGVELKRAGSRWKGRCPFHDEKTPSFTVDENFQNYRCWGCGVAGDILTYVQERENLSFIEALHRLADIAGVELESSPEEPKVDRDSLYEIVRLTANFYCREFNELSDDHPAKREISDRGLTWDNSNRDWVKYGYSPAGNKIAELLTGKGFSPELLVEAGVCGRDEKTGRLYDAFRSRLMFVFTDRFGKPIGFSSRKLFEDDRRGKYVNSTETPLFVKSRVLFNHALARRSCSKTKTVVVTEGQFDVSAFVAAGVPNCVASSGTAFTEEHLRECRRLVGDDGKIVYAFDPDEAGSKALLRTFREYPDFHRQSFVVSPPEGSGDPCDVYKTHGAEMLQTMVEKARPIVSEVFDRIARKHDLSTEEGRANYVRTAVNELVRITSGDVRSQALRKVSLDSLFPVDVLETMMSESTEVKKPRASNTVEVAKEVEKDDLSQLFESNDDFRAQVVFVRTGLSNVGWRASLMRSVPLLTHERLSTFVQQNENFMDRPVLHPEMFDDEEMARFVLQSSRTSRLDDLSPEETKSHYIRLHKMLQDSVSERRSKDEEQTRFSVLRSLDPTDVKGYKRLFDNVCDSSRDANNPS